MHPHMYTNAYVPKPTWLVRGQWTELPTEGKTKTKSPQFWVTALILSWCDELYAFKLSTTTLWISCEVDETHLRNIQDKSAL